MYFRAKNTLKNNHYHTSKPNTVILLSIKKTAKFVLLPEPISEEWRYSDHSNCQPSGLNHWTNVLLTKYYVKI